MFKTILRLRILKFYYFEIYFFEMSISIIDRALNATGSASGHFIE